MKIYVVTEGNYSGYHIVFCTLDKARAELFVKRYNKRDYEEYRVEEYDSDRINLFDNDRKMFEISMRENGYVSVYEREPCYHDMECSVNKVTRRKYRNIPAVLYEVNVMAEDEEHAKKIGEDLIYEYMARKAGVS